MQKIPLLSSLYFLAAITVASVVGGSVVHAVTPTPLPTQPDLVSINLVINAASADLIEGKSITFSANTKNFGSAAGPSKSVFCIDNIKTCKNTFKGRLPGAGYDISALSPTAISNPFTSVAWVATPGKHTVTNCSDANNNVTESKESNNCISKRFTVVRPNLIAGKLNVPSTVFSGTKPTFSVTTTNVGPGNSGGSVTRFCVDNLTTCRTSKTGEVSDHIVSALSAGISAGVTSDPNWVATLGNHTITACTNAAIPPETALVVSETTTRDNCVSAAFTVTSPPTPTPTPTPIPIPSPTPTPIITITPNPYDPITPAPNGYDAQTPGPNGYDGATGIPNAYTIQPTPIPLTATMTSPLANSTFTLGQDIPVAVSGNGTPSCGYWTLHMPSGEHLTLYSYDFVSGKQPGGMQSCAEPEHLPY